MKHRKVTPILLPLLAILALVLTIGCRSSSKGRTGPAANASATLQSPPPVVSTLIFPAPGENPEVNRTLARNELAKAPETDKPTQDILAKLGVKIENNYPEALGITDETIRGAADLSYSRVGIANPSLRGWTVAFQPAPDGGAQTMFVQKTKRIIVSIDPAMWRQSATHELTHVLEGSVVGDNLLPGFLKEFVATSGEDIDQLSTDFPIVYGRFNRPILSIAKTVNHDPHVINSGNAPLDGLRYDLLRAAGVKIGAEKWRTLARQIHDKALAAKTTLPLAEFKPAFDEAGIGDCVLFDTVETQGLYSDVAVLKNGTPVVIYKQIDQSGVESVPVASLRTVWRKKDKAIANWVGATMMGGTLFDTAGALYAPQADTYEVTIGTTKYTYKIAEPSAVN